MNIESIYNLFDKIGVLTFSTICGDEVMSRAAHFNGFDEDGIYFRTMWNKPFARQLVETGKVTVFGITSSNILDHDENHVPNFPPGYTIRLIGEVKQVPEEMIREKAKNNDILKLAEYDMDKYTAMRNGNFVIHKAKVEVFEYDFECTNRDHKILRTRFEFGGADFNKAGPTITEKCIECGLCKAKCSFKAIEEGSPFRVVSEKCDDCGDCLMTCPVDAIKLSKPF